VGSGGGGRCGEKEKIETTINRVLGLPEAAGKLAEIGTDAAKAKAGEIKQKATDLKERTELKIAETKDRLASRYEMARDSLFARAESLKNTTIAKAVELKNRAIKAGLEVGLNIEDKIAKAFEFPAVIKEAMAGKFSEKAKGAEKTRQATLAEQFSQMNGLAEEQRLALEAFLAEQLLQKETITQEHSDVRENLEEQVESARSRSQELKSDALKLRDAVEKRRVFKGLIARINK